MTRLAAVAAALAVLAGACTTSSSSDDTAGSVTVTETDPETTTTVAATTAEPPASDATSTTVFDVDAELDALFAEHDLPEDQADLYLAGVCDWASRAETSWVLSAALQYRDQPDPDLAHLAEHGDIAVVGALTTVCPEHGERLGIAGPADLWLGEPYPDAGAEAYQRWVDLVSDAGFGVGDETQDTFSQSAGLFCEMLAIAGVEGPLIIGATSEEEAVWIWAATYALCPEAAVDAGLESHDMLLEP